MFKKQKLIFFFIAQLFTWHAFGGGLEVYPSGGVSSFPPMPNKAVSSNSAASISANFFFNCYGINNRQPESPAAFDGCTNITQVIEGRAHPISFSFPNAYLDPYGVQAPNPSCRGAVMHNGKWQGRLNFTGANPPTDWHHVLEWNSTVHPPSTPVGFPSSNSLMVRVTTSYYPETVSIADDGQYKMDVRTTLVAGVTTVTQDGIVGGRDGYKFGMNAPLSAWVSAPSVTPNGQEINTYISLPGASYTWQPSNVDYGGYYRGFCGSFYSPLMLFFDKKRPKFHGVAMFPLLDDNTASYAWPEPNAPGYFLALDKNHNGKIDGGDELFGLDAQGKYPNGFEKLKSFDDNHDGVIDAKDKVFSKLVLWHDQNGDGKTDPGEITPMGVKKVVKISLKYNASAVTPMGGVAELRERSEFSFYDKEGSLTTGQVIDVWLSPLASPPVAVRK